MTHPDFPKKADFLPVDQAVKIKCRYCDIADICHRRPAKEKYEETGMLTRCTITPNRPGAKRKKRKKSKKA
jgi:hypothetical protein